LDSEEEPVGGSLTLVLLLFVLLLLLLLLLPARPQWLPARVCTTYTVYQPIRFWSVEFHAIS